MEYRKNAKAHSGGRKCDKIAAKGDNLDKISTIQSRITQNANALSRGEKKGAKRREKREQEVQEKKKKGVMY